MIYPIEPIEFQLSNNGYLLYLLYIYINIVICQALTKMSHNFDYGLLQKLNKCRSQQSFKFTHKFAQHSSNNNTRPKIQAFRSKKRQSFNHHHQNESKESCASEQSNEGRKVLCRIKSVDQLSKIRQTATFENIVALYKKENDNLKKQNKYLVEQIRKKQKNEEVLNNYIQQLRKQIRGLQQKIHVSPSTSRSKAVSITKIPKIPRDSRQSNPMFSTKTSVQSKGLIYMQGDTCNTLHQIQQLNQRFNSLMDQCSKQSCPRTRNLLRGKLAQTAEKLRNFKKQFNNIQ